MPARNELRIVLPLPPIGKQRREGSGSSATTPTKTKRWTKDACLILQAAWRAKPIFGPCMIHIVAVKKRRAKRPPALPARLWNDERCWCPVTPDFDNVEKMVADAITKSKIWKDDGLVVWSSCVMLYAAIGERPCVEVYVREITTAYTPNGEPK